MKVLIILCCQVLETQNPFMCLKTVSIFVTHLHVIHDVQDMFYVHIF